MKPHYKLYLLLLCLSLCIGATAGDFQRMTIVIPGYLYDTYPIDKYDVAKNAVKAAAPNEYDAIVLHSVKTGWPSAMAGSKNFKVYNHIRNYTVYKVAEFDGKVLLKVPQAENKHMPADFQAGYDFYLIMDSHAARAFGDTLPVKDFSKIHPGKLARINDPDEVFYGMTFLANKYVDTLKQQLGEEYEYVAVYSHPSNYPEGIVFGDPNSAFKKEYDYMVYIIASCGENYVVRVPEDVNLLMSETLKPKRDFYMLLPQRAVTFVKWRMPRFC